MAGQGFLLKSFNIVNKWILSNGVNNVAALQTPIRTLKLETKERLKTLNIPDKPKKPLTPYLQFITENRNVLLKQNPNLKQVDIIKQLSAEWKNVSEANKSKYKEKFEKEREVYDKELLKFNMNLTEEQKEALYIVSSEKKSEKKKRKLNKLIKETDKPKRPMGPYLLFLKEQSQSRNIPQNILMKSIKDEWSKVPEAEKQRYKNEYQKELEKYEVKLKQWEKRMEADGHPELIRMKTKLENKPSRIVDLKGKKSNE